MGIVMQIIKSVGVLSVAKIMGAIYLVMGLLFSPIFLFMGMLGSMLGQRPNPLGAIGGVAMAIIMPIFYGGMGFILGAIGAALYNLMARAMGGIEIEFELPSAEPVSALDPSPPQIATSQANI